MARASHTVYVRNSKIILLALAIQSLAIMVLVLMFSSAEYRIPENIKQSCLDNGHVRLNGVNFICEKL